MIKYEVVYSDRRTLALEITRDLRVLVRAPRKMPKAAIGRFVESNGAWIAEHMKRAADNLAAHPEPSEAEAAALIAAAREYIPPRVKYFAEIMGVTPTGITITGARTRHGSCSGKNSLSFSYRVMQYDRELVDYVIVHELAHIKHHDHSAAFYAFIESVMPDHKERRKKLKE